MTDSSPGAAGGVVTAELPLRTLVTHKVMNVTALPNTRRFVTSGEKEGTLTVGSLDGAELATFPHGVKDKWGGPLKARALLGVSADQLLVSDGTVAARLRITATGCELLTSWNLEGATGVWVSLAAAPGGESFALASGANLAVLGADGKPSAKQSAPDEFRQHFAAVAFSPSGQRVAVGRGDGRVEIRRAENLELVRSFPVSDEAPLALIFRDEQTLVVASDDRRTRRVQVETGQAQLLSTYSELFMPATGGLSQRGNGKVSGLHLLAPGRFVVVGLSRQVSVFEGDEELRTDFFDAALGTRYVQGSAVTSDGATVLLACEEAGLRAVQTSDLRRTGLDSDNPLRVANAVKALVTTQDPRLRERVRSLSGRKDAPIIDAVLEARGAWGDDVGPMLLDALSHENNVLVMNALRVAIGSRVPGLVDRLPALFRRPEDYLRYDAVNAFGTLAHGAKERSHEVKPLLQDSADHVVFSAVWALGELGDEAAAEWVAPLLRDPRPKMTPTVLATLIKLAPARYANEIAETLRAGSGLTLDLAFRRLGVAPAALGTRLPPERDAAAQTALAPSTARSWFLEAGIAVAEGELPTTALAPLSKGSAWWHLGLAFAAATGWGVIMEGDKPRFVPPDEFVPYWKSWLESPGATLKL